MTGLEKSCGISLLSTSPKHIQIVFEIEDLFMVCSMTRQCQIMLQKQFEKDQGMNPCETF